MSGKMISFKSTTAQRNGVKPYCKDLRPSKSEADWAKGMAQMSAAEKGKLQATIRKYECQLLAFKSALKAEGAEVYASAQKDAKARMKEVKELKLDDSSDDDDDDLSDYGGDDSEAERKTSAASAPAVKGKAPKEKQAGGRKKGFASKATFLFFNADFQLRIKEDSAFREKMMKDHNWDGSYSKGAAKDENKITIMTVQGKEWTKFVNFCKEEGDDEEHKSAREKMKTFESLAEASKKECNEALEKYKALLTTDPEAAAKFQEERTKKK